MANPASDSATIQIASPLVKGLSSQQGVGQGTTTTTQSIVTFTPTGKATGLSQEVFGTVAILATSRGDIEDLGGVRVQHVHDRHAYRLSEELVITSQLIADTLADPQPVVRGENHIGQVGGESDVLDVTLTLDTSGAYAAGDLLADTQVVPLAVRVLGGRAVLQSITVIDEDDQGAAMDIYLLDANVTLGTENVAPTLTDPASRNVLGYVSVSIADYKDLGGTRVATIRALGLICKATSRDLYVAAVTQGTPTHTATGVRLRLGFLQD